LTRVLLTGGSGFLGRHLREAIEKNHEVQLISPTRQDLDLKDTDAVSQYWRHHRPDVLIHAAAFARGLGGNLSALEKAFILNEQVIRSALLAALEHGVERVIFVGSVAEYAYPYPSLPIREEFALQGLPHAGEVYYGLAKRLADNYLDAIRIRWGAQASHLYLTNMYGPGDRFDTEGGHVVASMMKKIWHQREIGATEVVLWGRPDTTRDFLFAPDAADAISRLLALPNLGEQQINIASGREETMGDLAGHITRLTAFKGSIRWDDSKPIGITSRSVSTERLEALVDFKTTPLAKGLAKTIESQGWLSC